MPNLEFRNVGNDPLLNTVMTPTGINMTELLTYMDPQMEYFERNENFTSFDLTGDPSGFLNVPSGK